MGVMGECEARKQGAAIAEALLPRPRTTHRAAQRGQAPRASLRKELDLVKSEVVRALVAARALLADLHQYIVEQRRSADPVEVGGQPVGAERLVELHEVLHSLFRLADAARGLHS